MVDLEYNISVYREHEANRWKFLEPMDPNLASRSDYIIRSPKPIIVLTIAYLLFVCKIGPAIMRHREPFEFKRLIRFYNLAMVFLAAFMVWTLHSCIGTFSSLFECDKMFTFEDDSAINVYRVANISLFVRVSEYFDTIFFTLRKKTNQVTFLHVFHHAFVPIYAYWTFRTAPLRFNSYIMYINSAVHVIMYFYYYLATFQQHSQGKLQRQSFLMSLVRWLLKFKRYVTQLQILQFVSLALYSATTIVRPNKCQVPWTYILANLTMALGFLGLFSHFYIKSFRSIRTKTAKIE